MSLRRSYKKRSRRSCKKRSKRSYKKRSRRSYKKRSSDQRITPEFIKSFILSYIPNIDGLKIRRPPVKKTFFKPKKRAAERRPSVILKEDTKNDIVEDEEIDTYVPVQVLNIDNINTVPEVLTNYIPIKVEEKSEPLSYSDYTQEIEKREREEREKSEKYKVRRKYDEGKYYFKLIYTEPDIVYSKIKELYKDDDYIKELNDNTLYTPQEKDMLTFIYIYENELQNFNRDHKEAYDYFDANYTKNEFKKAYKDYYFSKKIQRIRDSIYLKDEYKPKLILIELYKKVTKKREITLENVKHYKEFARKIGKDISEKFVKATDYLKYKFQFTSFLVFEEYINYLLNKYKNNSVIKDIIKNKNNENAKIIDMLIIIYLQILTDTPTEENVQLYINGELENLIPIPIFYDKNIREQQTNYKYKIAISYFEGVYGSVNTDKNINILFEKYNEFLTGKNYQENLIILMKLHQDSIKKDNLNYNSAMNYFNSKFGKNAVNIIQKLQERYEKQLQDKDNYERIPILKEIYINETKDLNRLYKKALDYFIRITKSPLNVDRYIASRINNYKNIIDLYISQGYADLEGVKIFGFEKDKDIYDKTVAIIIYLTEDEIHKREVDERYFQRKYLKDDKNKIDLLKLRYGDVNLPDNEKIIYFGNIDNEENALVGSIYKMASVYFKKKYNFNDEQIRKYVNEKLKKQTNIEVEKYINLGYYPVKYKNNNIDYTFYVRKYNYDDDIRDKINAYIIYISEYNRDIEEKKEREEREELNLRKQTEEFANEITKVATDYFRINYPDENVLKSRLNSLERDYAKELNRIYNKDGITIGWKFYKFDNLTDPKNEKIKKQITLYFLYTKEQEELIVENKFKKALKYFYDTYPNVAPTTIAIPGAGAGPPLEVLPGPDIITPSQLRTLFIGSQSAPFIRLRQLSNSYDKYIKRYWDYTYPEARMLKYKIYCYYLYDLITKENKTFIENFKTIYSAAALIIEYIFSWLNWVGTPFIFIYDWYRNIGIKNLLDQDRIQVQINVQPTIQQLLTQNTNNNLQIRDSLDTNLEQLTQIATSLAAIQNQGINVNPQFNVLIQQYITRIDEVRQELNRTVTETAGRSAVLTGQVLQRLRQNAESLDRNTQEVANLVAASRAGSVYGTSTTTQRRDRSPLTSAETSPLREETFQ